MAAELEHPLVFLGRRSKDRNIVKVLAEQRAAASARVPAGRALGRVAAVARGRASLPAASTSPAAPTAIGLIDLLAGRTGNANRAGSAFNASAQTPFLNFDIFLLDCRTAQLTTASSPPSPARPASAARPSCSPR